MSVQAVEEVLGNRTITHLKTYTNYMVEGVDSTKTRTRELGIELGYALKARYPNAGFLSIAE